MDVQTARILVYAIAAVGAVVWLAALRFLASTRRLRSTAASRRIELAEATPENVISGGAEVDGTAVELSSKAAAVLARSGSGVLGPLKILERTDEKVAFEGTGPDPTGRSAGRRVRRGQLRLYPAGPSRTRVDYEVEISGARGLWIAAVACQLAGLIALVAGVWAINTFVASHPNPNVRGQAFQMFQVVHLLWPPFLFAGLYRRGHKVVRAEIETLVHNLPYHGDA